MKANYRTYLCCHKDVWDEIILIRSINSKVPKSQLSTEECDKLEKVLWTTIVTTDRSAKNPRENSCFYREFEDGMLLDAAEELEKRETIQKDAAADRKITKVVAWATIGTAVATILTNVIGHFWK
jgi:hypothetical protein